MRRVQRIWLTPAYLLHQYAYRDTSRIAEFFTRDHGRISLFARGARTPKSALRAGLRPFQRLLISWNARGDSGQLTAAEIDGAFAQLPTGSLMSGFYVNELVMKLTERWDPQPHLFEVFDRTVTDLAASAAEAPVLRRFEKRLLELLGYGIDFSVTEASEAVCGGEHYSIRPQRGVVPCAQDSSEGYIGRSLLELAAESFENVQTLRDARKILRAAIEHCLEGRPLRSREVFAALRQSNLA